ncbi:MAG: MBL fold metallo-hydrolase [Gammaproteobacteria bacterium]|nr:MBL fold metallo-hydrolase [Gammaproteobacteria bacterium]MDH5617190.1 MBL fold metallo-hydrolase [Gammaproteobacteria bacterium]
MSKPQVTAFFDEATFTVTYVVADTATGRAAVVDPVLDFDPSSGRTSTASADDVIRYVKDNGLSVDWILETHVHADHLSGAPYIREHLGGKTAIGRDVTAVQETFKGVFNLKDLATDGSQFDHLFADAETFSVGAIDGRVIATPGHTPACVTYVIGDAAFVGDTLFMPDFGTARTDFPGGSAASLYTSIRKILALPDATRLLMCHDYKAPGRDAYAWETSVAEQRANNIHINDSVSPDEFVAMREGRDSQLGMPRLILPSLQVNLRAGRLPEPEDNDIRYLKIPLDAV